MTLKDRLSELFNNFTKEKYDSSFLLVICILIYLNRCQEFLNYIDTYFLINDQSPSRLELMNRVLSIENQLNEYNQEITNVNH
jgi:hypothetical protein